MIDYYTGNLFDYVNSDIPLRVLIPHITNNAGQWGAGFVVPLGTHFPDAKNEYLKGIVEAAGAGVIDDVLGSVQFVTSPGMGNVHVANMFAQNNRDPEPCNTKGRRVNYMDLLACMTFVSNYCFYRNINLIAAPLFGTGIAGCDWDVIEEMIEDTWCAQGISVSIFQMPGQEKRNSNPIPQKLE